MEETYSMTGETEGPENTSFSRMRVKTLHLFVLCHGFQGNSYDMRLIKNNILMINPSAVFLCSSANQDNTEGDIEVMVFS